MILPAFIPECLEIAQLKQNIKPSPQEYLNMPFKPANLVILRCTALG